MTEMKQFFGGTPDEIIQELIDIFDNNAIYNDVVESIKDSTEPVSEDLYEELLVYLPSTLWDLPESAVIIQLEDNFAQVLHPDAEIPNVTHGPWNIYDHNAPHVKGAHKNTLTLRTTSFGIEIPKEANFSIMKDHNSAPNGVYITFPDETDLRFSVVALPRGEDGTAHIESKYENFIETGRNAVKIDSKWGPSIALYDTEGENLTSLLVFAVGDLWIAECFLNFKGDNPDYEARTSDLENLLDECIVDRGDMPLIPYAAMDCSVVYSEKEQLEPQHVA